MIDFGYYNADCMDIMRQLPDKSIERGRGNVKIGHYSKEMKIGKIGEYLVCADLLEKGFIAYPVEYGLPYDVILQVENKLFKVQVKTTMKPRKVPQRSKDTYAYIFNGSACGKKHQSEYNKCEIDVFALVAVDNKQIGYVKSEDFKKTVVARVDALRGTYYDEKCFNSYEKVCEMHNQGVSNIKIGKSLGLSETTVGRMLKEGYEPYRTKAKYMSDLEREASWFYEL